MKIWLDRQRSAALLLTFLGVVLSGCGDRDAVRSVPASGKATYKGEPISKGTIQFVPDKGRAASGQIIDGSFTMTTTEPGDGAIPGKHKVGVLVAEEVPTKGGDTTLKYLVPQKFSDPEQSGLTVEIPPGGKKDIVIDVPAK